MKVAIIEDDVNKRSQIRDLVVATLPAKVLEARSFNSGRKIILLERPDIVLLDMSMPTFDVSQADKGGRHRAFGGRDVLDEITRRGCTSKVIIVTQFDIFGDGSDRKTLDELKNELEQAYPQSYVGAVYYHPALSSWQRELSQLLIDTAGIT
jgi:CheY-like chemotaxis protein